MALEAFSRVKSDDLPHWLDKPHEAIRSAAGLDGCARGAAVRSGVGVGVDAIALFCALGYAGFEVYSGTAEIGGNEADVEPLPKPPKNMGDEELAQALSPVLVFSKDQRWLPERVDRLHQAARA